MSGYVRTGRDNRLTYPQHDAVVQLLDAYLARPWPCDDVESDYLPTIALKLRAQREGQEASNRMLRVDDAHRLTLRQHKSLVHLVRSFLADPAVAHGIDLERVRHALPKLERVFDLSSQQSRRSMAQIARTEGKPIAYWQKRLAAARFLKAQTGGRTIWRERIA